MKVLFDTHTFIWFTQGIDKLSEKATQEIDNPANEKFISTVSLWEIAIKSGLNKIELKRSFSEINRFIITSDVTLITIEMNHFEKLLSLPYHHNDPFDRLLISQAISEDMTLISADKHFASYPVKLSW